ncbi:MAG: hypothetical protein L0191_11210 [Acidobacteria bacterium]|nr:hypothetical protein [Acidobacteriota bacterium]
MPELLHHHDAQAAVPDGIPNGARLAYSVRTVYLETTVVSYLVARPGRDLVVAAHRQISREYGAEPAAVSSSSSRRRS